jgi:hypothetical protein
MKRKELSAARIISHTCARAFLRKYPVVSTANIGAVNFEVNFKKPVLMVQILKLISPLESLVVSL